MLSATSSCCEHSGSGEVNVSFPEGWPGAVSEGPGSACSVASEGSSIVALSPKLNMESWERTLRKRLRWRLWRRRRFFGSAAGACWPSLSAFIFGFLAAEGTSSSSGISLRFLVFGLHNVPCRSS
ncbi:hypothetical protein MTO96_049676 [Rhipicephalus appendiculatus]